MMRSSIRPLLAVLCAVCVASCSPAGSPRGTVPYAATRGSALPNASNGKATLAFAIPSKGISSGTSSVLVTVNGKVALQSGVSGTTFSATFDVPSGKDVFYIGLINRYGSPLSIARFTQQIASGASVTLHPKFLRDVASGTFNATPASPPAGTPAKIALTFEAFDANEQPIDDTPYADPVLVAFDRGPGSHMRLSQKTFAKPQDRATIYYDGKLMGGYAVVSTKQVRAQDLKLVGNAYANIPVNGEVQAMAKGPGDTLLYAACNRSCTIFQLDSTGKSKRIAQTDTVRGMALGPDNNIWIAEGVHAHGPSVAKVTFAGVFTHYLVGTGGARSGTLSITAGPDGNLWFTEEAYRAGRISTSGEATEFPVNLSGGFLQYIVAGGDRKVYIASTQAGYCIVTLALKTTCGGNAGGSYYGGQMVWYRNRLVMQGGKTGHAYLDENGVVHPFDRPTQYLVQPMAAAGGVLFGFTAPAFGDSPAVGTFDLTKTAIAPTWYPTPSGDISASSWMVAGDHGQVWIRSFGAQYITKFTYLP